MHLVERAHKYFDKLIVLNTSAVGSTNLGTRPVQTGLNNAPWTKCSRIEHEAYYGEHLDFCLNGIEKVASTDKAVIGGAHFGSPFRAA